MEQQYQIYIIKSTKDGNMFAGITGTQDTNLLRWLFNKSKSSGQYAKLAESIKVNGYANHSFQRTNLKFKYKNEAEETLKKIQIKLLADGKLLNDSVVDTEKYVCEYCGKTIRVCYREGHLEKYCPKTTNDFINSLLE